MLAVCESKLHVLRIKLLKAWPVVGQMEWQSFLGALSILFVLLFSPLNEIRVGFPEAPTACTLP